MMFLGFKTINLFCQSGKNKFGEQPELLGKWKFG